MLHGSRLVNLQSKKRVGGGGKYYITRETLGDDPQTETQAHQKTEFESEDDRKYHTTTPAGLQGNNSELHL